MRSARRLVSAVGLLVVLFAAMGGCGDRRDRDVRWPDALKPMRTSGRIPVLMVNWSREAWFLEDVLRSDWNLDVHRMTPEQFTEAYLDQHRLPEGMVVIITGWRPPKLPPGRYMLWGIVPPFKEFALRERSEKSEDLETVAGHPIFAYPEVRLYSSRVLKAMHLAGPPDAEPLLRTHEGALVAATLDRRNLRLIAFGFEDSQSDFYRERGFRQFIYRTVEFLAGRLSVPPRPEGT